MNGIRTFLAIPLLMVSTYVFAGPVGWYKVEIIAFEHVTQRAWQSETWPDVSPNTTVSNATPLAPVGTQQPIPAYQRLPRSLLSLMAEEHALNRQPDYKVLLHAAWYQPFTQNAPLQRIVLDGGSSDSWQVNGTLGIGLSRYFTLTTNLTFCGQLEGVAGIRCFSLAQKRRLKGRELNYIDHPLFGLLIKVTAMTKEG